MTTSLKHDTKIMNWGETWLQCRLPICARPQSSLLWFNIWPQQMATPLNNNNNIHKKQLEPNPFKPNSYVLNSKVWNENRFKTFLQHENVNIWKLNIISFPQVCVSWHGTKCIRQCIILKYPEMCKSTRSGPQMSTSLKHDTKIMNWG